MGWIRTFHDGTLPQPKSSGGKQEDKKPEKVFDGNVAEPDQGKVNTEKGWNIVEGDKSSSKDSSPEDED